MRITRTVTLKIPMERVTVEDRRVHLEIDAQELSPMAMEILEETFPNTQHLIEKAFETEALMSIL